LALSAGVLRRNCFRENRAAKTMPARLQKRPCRLVGGDRRVSQQLEALHATLMDRAQRAIDPIPYTSLPPPPRQANWPG
jgi:hypothetical protein